MYETMIRKKFLLICLSLLFLSSCNSTQSTRVADSNKTIPESVTYGIKEVPVVYTTISEISERADIVIIGNPVETREVVNTARIPGDPEKPDPDHFSIGQIYEVLVDEYVKGSGDKNIFIIQHQGSMITNSSAPSIEEIENARAEYKYIPLTSNKKYLMFLMYTTHSYKGYSHEKIFTAVGHPWLFELSNANCVQLADTLTELSNYFPVQSLPNFISQVNGSFGVDEPGNTPYPLPEGDSACIEEPVQPYH